MGLFVSNKIQAKHPPQKKTEEANSLLYHQHWEIVDQVHSTPLGLPKRVWNRVFSNAGMLDVNYVAYPS